MEYGSLVDLLGLEEEFEQEHQEDLDLLVKFMSKHNYVDAIFPGDYRSSDNPGIVVPVTVGELKVYILVHEDTLAIVEEEKDVKVFVVSYGDFYGEMSEYELAVKLNELLLEEDDLTDLMEDVFNYLSNCDSGDHYLYNGLSIEN